MKYCRACGKQIQDADAFCGACGASQKEKVAVSQGRQWAPREPRNRWVPALETEEGRVRFKKISDAHRKSFQRYLLISLLGFLLAGAMVLFYPSPYSFAPAVVAVISIVLMLEVGWSEREYYSVPGSMDTDGNHRCIFCGNKGIYHHGKYKSYVKYADCSKCKKNLWSG